MTGQATPPGPGYGGAGRWWLSGATVPACLLEAADAARLPVPAVASSTAARQVAVGIDAGHVVAIEPAVPASAASNEPVAEVRGAWLASAFVDPHTHLDKGDLLAMGLPQHRRLFDAIDAVRADYALWTADELHARASFALQTARAHGVRALNTYADWPAVAGAVDPGVPLASWAVLEGLRDAWRGRIDLTITSLVTIDAFADPAVGTAIARRLAASQGILGVFVYPAPHVPALIPRVFELAERWDLPVDFHVDEHLVPAVANLPTVVAEAHRRGWGSRTVCGHNCVLQTLPVDGRDRLLDAVAAAGCTLVALPATNLHLQDSAQQPPWTTPRLRGLLPVHEARQRGIAVAFGADNHRDPFFPAGDLDPLQTLALAASVGQLDDPAFHWADAITTVPARALGCRWDGVLRIGAPADLVVHDGRSNAELLSRTAGHRRVLRAGRWLEGADAALPDFRLLDPWRAGREQRRGTTATR
jgi:cytosine/creatinine deaminase